MPRITRVHDLDDPRLGDYLHLTDVALRRRHEPERGMFIAEGEVVIRRAVAAGYPMRSVLTEQRWLPALADLLEGTDVPVLVADDAQLEQVTGFQVHRGALAAMGRRPLPSVEDLVGSADRVVVLEDVNNHTNVGAVFRSAAALGMDGVVLSPRCADPLYRRSVRVSMGSVFSLRYARMTDWRGGLEQLRSAGLQLLALTPAPHARAIDEVEPARLRRSALLLGAEGPGLSPRWVEQADLAVRIPMAHGVDSLNVAAAAAVACWVVTRAGVGDQHPGIGAG